MEDDDEELKYKICDQDYIFDLLSICDLTSLIEMMIRVKILIVPIWKNRCWNMLVLAFIQVAHAVTCKNMPTLETHETDIVNMQFKGTDLREGYLVVAETKGKDGIKQASLG